MEGRQKKLIALVLLIAIALASFTLVAGYMGDPDNHAASIANLQEKQNDVMEMAALVVTTSTVVAAIPGDATTPIAEKMADLTTPLLAVLCMIFLEKYLITISGYLTFKYIIPIVCAILIINLFTGIEALKKIAVKLVIFGLAITLVVPISIKISDIITATYGVTIDAVISETQDDLSDVEGDSTSTQEDEESLSDIANDEDASIWEKMSSIASKIKDKAADAAETISENLDFAGEKVQEMLQRFIEWIAVELVTNCVIPVLVFVVMIWFIKILFGVEIDTKQFRLPGKKEKSENDITKTA